MRRYVAVLLAAATEAAAQCVMCQRTAAAQMEARAQALNSGILVLGIPPLVLLAGVLILAFSRRDSGQDGTR